MNRSKIVFEDQGTTKVLKGFIEDLDQDLIKVLTVEGNVYVSKKHITFIRELGDNE